MPVPLSTIETEIKSLFISNDRFGVKPLYFYKSSEKAIFTSEIKQFHFFNSILNVNFLYRQ